MVEWRAWAEHTKRLKPATLRNYDALLSAPGEPATGGGSHLARIMRAFGERTIASITTAEVERFLRGLDRKGLPGRSVNAHRQALMNVFEYATREDSFAVPVNPVRKTDKRREDYSKPPETFTAEQLMALARAPREGLHLNGGRRWASAEEDHEQQRSNAQDAGTRVQARRWQSDFAHSGTVGADDVMPVRQQCRAGPRRRAEVARCCSAPEAIAPGPWLLSRDTSGAALGDRAPALGREQQFGAAIDDCRFV